MDSDDAVDSPATLHDHRWLQLLLDVALIANEAESLDGALATAMGRVCQHNGWYAAFCHVPERIRDVWWHEPVARDSAADVDRELQTLAKPWALQVMQAGRTEYIDDFRDIDKDRIDLPGPAPVAGGAVATPLLVGTRPVGAMVFFSRQPLTEQVDEDLLGELLDVIESTGTQMGRVVERWYLWRRVADETEEEREALGRQIHDGIAQQLVGVKLLAQNLRKRMGSGSDPYSDQWNLLIDSLIQAQTEARAVARGLSAGAILSSSDTLVGQLEELCDIVRTGHGVESRLEVHGTLSLPDQLTRAHLVRIAREAVMNSLRHGQPSRIDIEILAESDRLVLEIRDNGSGIPDDASSATGMGKIGMRYRAITIGARLEIESAPGKGTTVRCVL